MNGAEESDWIAQLFAVNRDRLQVYLRARLANEEDAAELAQETYLRLLRVKRLDLIRHPQAYLYRIARNLLYELYTSRRIDTDTEIDFDLIQSEEPTPEELAILTVRREQIEEAMKELSPKCRAALLLHWHEGLTQAEIGERLKLSRQMVQKYLAQGLAHCQKRLRRFGTKDEGKIQ